MVSPKKELKLNSITATQIRGCGARVKIFGLRLDVMLDPVSQNTDEGD